MGSKKIVMNVGHCVPDHLSIKKLLDSIGVEVEKIDTVKDTIENLKKNKNKYSLILINRKLDIDFSDGIELLKKIKSDPEIQHHKVMVISNYKEVQTKAVELGALYGFGKSELHKEETKEKILKALEN